MGKMIAQNVINGPEPSTLAASITSSGTDCSPASSTSMTNGVHSQATIKVTLSRGNEENQGTAGRPMLCKTQSTMPKLGLSIRFFQTSAITEGVTRNGMVTSPRSTFLPQIGRLRSKASMVPAINAMIIAPKTSSAVCPITGQKLGSATNSLM